MEKSSIKKILVVLTLIILFFAVLSPSIAVSSQKINLDKSNDEISPRERELIKVKAQKYHNGRIQSNNIVEIRIYDLENIKNQIISLFDSNLSIRDKFSGCLDILKSYGLISDNIELSDLYDTSYFEGLFDVVSNENFMAYFAPIVVVGGGFGLGLGEIYKPFNVFLHLLLAVGGLAWTFCLSPIEGKLYTLQSSLLPIDFGYLASYSGFIIFAVEPGFFYSNIVAIGFTPFTVWIQFPSI